MVARLNTPSRRGRSRRRLAAITLLLAVVAVHGWLVDRLEDSMIGWGADGQAPKRIEVAFVRELRPRAVAPTVVAVAAKRRAAPPHTRAATPVQAARDTSVPVTPPVPAASEPSARPADAAASQVAQAPDLPLPASAPALEPAASAAIDEPRPMPPPAVETAASAPDAPAFDWPPSTRLRYALTGNYRGRIEGSAQVQWVRVDTHYQVQMDVSVGLPILPLMTRRVTSDGDITEQGLRPRRFDEQTKVAFKPPWHVNLQFADDRVRNAAGAVLFTPPGVQDSASQFVQLTWLFTMHPDWLQTGRSVQFPLALNRRVDWRTYDVLEADTLYTNFGQVPVFHVKPRPLADRRGVLEVECWFAPGLQNLPARILIRENDDTYVDLLLDQPPLQAEQ